MTNNNVSDNNQNNRKTSEKKVFVWNSKKVEGCLKSIEEGDAVQRNPFFNGDIDWKDGNIIYEYTNDELDEIKKCASDVVYFGNTYCYAMTDAGVTKIFLRDYQIDVLENFQNNRFNVFLSSRQSGKCVYRQTLVSVMYGGETFMIPIYMMFYKFMKNKKSVDKLIFFVSKIESRIIYGSDRYNDFLKFYKK